MRKTSKEEDGSFMYALSQKDIKEMIKQRYKKLLASIKKSGMRYYIISDECGTDIMVGKWRKSNG